MRHLARLFRIAIVGGCGLALATVALVPMMVSFFTAGTVGRDRRINLQPLSQRSVVYDRRGNVLAVLHAEQNRVVVPLAQVPMPVRRAILDIEDERFYQHGPVDLRSLSRALFTNVEAGGIRQGGSTITQQLVKNALLTSKRDIGRKAKEALLAIRLEDQMTKDQILERYLNTIYFGHGAYGVQAAAETYFGVGVEQLDIGKAAFLAGLIRNPVGTDPVLFPEASRARRNVAIDRIAQLGDMTPAQAAAYKAEPLPKPTELLPPPNDYFVEQVVELLLADKRLGDTFQDRYHSVFGGGLQIHTTLDPDWQQIAQDSVRRILPDTDGEFTAALVSIDPTTGAVRDLVGGPGFEKSKFNLVTDGLGRQPGSSFKPFSLIAALEEGHSIYDTIDGSMPCPIPNPGGRPNPYTPNNVEGEGAGVMTLDAAMAASVNCVYAQLGYIAGLGKVAAVARKMGVKHAQIHLVPAMPLGTESVRPIEMATAYATIAADGIYHGPYFVESVDDRKGNELFHAKTKGERVIDSQIARLTTRVLRGVVNHGTGTAAYLPDRPVAGKTGTAEDNHDAWFDGYTPQLATSVWMGAPTGEIPMRNVGGITVFGGNYPARIWRLFTEQALAGQPVMDFPKPDDSQLPPSRYLSIGGRPPNAQSTTSSPSTTSGPTTSAVPGKAGFGASTTIGPG
ncbi:MAG: transglycosylase domain-containing protein, partial [Acidimicrobiales bacterium]